MRSEGSSGRPDLSAVEPLTFAKKDGTRYARPEAIELEIATALERPLGELIDGDGTSSHSSGCLLYFLRRFRPNRRTPFHDRLLMLVLERADRIVRNNLHGIPAERHEEIRLGVRDRILDLLLTGSDKLDFFEAVFNRAVKLLTITFRRKVKRDVTEAIEDLARPDEDRSGIDELDGMISKAAMGAMAQPEASAELNRIMALLTEKERDAVIAVHLMGLQEESDDPEEWTAATQLGISGRMVRYRLKSAETKARAAGESKS